MADEIITAESYRCCCSPQR